jgi:hypothetical protein
VSKLEFGGCSLLRLVFLEKHFDRLDERFPFDELQYEILLRVPFLKVVNRANVHI